MTVSTREIADFYDRYTGQQRLAAFNERHYTLCRVLRDLGLRADSSVLEFGCGIGVMTRLLAASTLHGRILAVDLSPQSVALARGAVAAWPHATVLEGDVTSFQASGGPFDFVTLFDVLEHVPADLHRAVFRTLSAHAGTRTQVLINIPNPAYQQYLKQHAPERLQIVDQAVGSAELLAYADENDLALVTCATYGVWHESEYQLFVLRRKAPFQLKKLPIGGLRARLQTALFLRFPRLVGAPGRRVLPRS